MSTVRKLYKPVRCLRINPIFKCKHSFENQEVGRHLETDSQITTRGTVSKAISIYCKLSHLGGKCAVLHDLWWDKASGQEISGRYRGDFSNNKRFGRSRSRPRATQFSGNFRRNDRSKQYVKIRFKSNYKLRQYWIF